MVFDKVFRYTCYWSKYDDRLMKAAERGDVEKLSSVLAKKGVNPTKLDKILSKRVYTTSILD
uniref:Uncharacterized protein n=1 Tax=Gopherus agassizii TaxID=38772 RepID=A0A452GP46_9SAUR